MQRNDLGTAVLGGTIALVGVLLLLDRSGALTWPGHWGIWPLLLIGYGLSRMVQSRYEAPRGLFPLAVGVWFFGGQARWFSLRETWPLLVVALGLGIAWGHVGRPYRDTLVYDGTPATPAETLVELTWRAEVAPWLAVVPNVQFVADPGALQAVGDAWIVGLRFEVSQDHDWQLAARRDGAADGSYARRE